MSYVLRDVGSKKYFVNPSFQSWSFTAEIAEATHFTSLDDAKQTRDAVNLGSSLTYWDYSDIIPKAEVLHDGIPMNEPSENYNMNWY